MNERTYDTVKNYTPPTAHSGREGVNKSMSDPKQGSIILQNRRILASLVQGWECENHFHQQY